MVKNKPKNEQKVTEKKLRLSPIEFEIVRRMINYADCWGTVRLPTGASCAKLLENCPKEFMPNCIPGDGWLLKEIIESPKSPYPKNKRWEYLTHSLGDKKDIIDYRQLQPRAKGIGRRSKRIYKLKNDRETFIELFKIFKEKKAIYEFLASDYCKDSKLADYFKVRFFAKDADVEKLREEDYEKYVDIVFDSTAQCDENRTLYMIPHSLIMAELEGFDIPEAARKIGYNKILKSFLVYDYVTCDNEKYKELYRIALNKIEQLEVNSKK